MTTIYLYEDNGGGLYLGPNRDGKYYDVTMVQDKSSFADDAAAIAAGDDDDWTVEQYDEPDHPTTKLVATYSDGDVAWERNYAGRVIAGIAGSIYLHIPDEELD